MYLSQRQILADISASQQPFSFLSSAFSWLDIYPALDWLKGRKYSSLLCTPYPFLALLVSFNYRALGLQRNRFKALKHLAWPHKGHKFRIHGIFACINRL